jgi:hypothetical protein
LGAKNAVVQGSYSGVIVVFGVSGLIVLQFTLADTSILATVIISKIIRFDVAHCCTFHAAGHKKQKR